MAMANGWLGKIWHRIRATSRPDALNRDLDDELAFHVAQRTDKNRDAGMDAAEARHAANRQLGNITNLKERTREVRILTSLESLWRDFTYALRALRKKPGFTAVAIATLALGIGSSTAIFSVIENVLIEPFPYPGADRFMTVEIHDANNVDAAGRAEYSSPNFSTTSKKITSSTSQSPMPVKMSSIKSAAEWNACTGFSARRTRLNFSACPRYTAA